MTNKAGRRKRRERRGQRGVGAKNQSKHLYNTWKRRQVAEQVGMGSRRPGRTAQDAENAFRAHVQNRRMNHVRTRRSERARVLHTLNTTPSPLSQLPPALKRLITQKAA